MNTLGDDIAIGITDGQIVSIIAGALILASVIVWAVLFAINSFRQLDL